MRFKLFRKKFRKLILLFSLQPKNKGRITSILACCVLILCFQNCSKGHIDTASQTGDSSNSQTNTPSAPTPMTPAPSMPSPNPIPLPAPAPQPAPNTFKITTGPTTSAITTSTVSIQWSLSEVANGQVEYGVSTSYGNFSTAERSFNYSSHQQNISGLSAATTYHFRVISKNASGVQIFSNDYTFKTASNPVVVTPPPVPTPSPTPAPPVSSCAGSAVAASIGSQAAWDAKFDGRYGAQGPALTAGAETFAWQGHYWVRAYVSMAKTYGSTKYLDLAVKMIDYWFANQESSTGWGASINPAQMMLDTGVISQAVAIFSYQVWNDARFSAYRNKADQYVTKLESILHTYDAQWVDKAPYPGSPGFYVYATCGGICSSASLMMYNQGAALSKALLLIDRIKRLKGLAGDSGYVHKADSAAAYFKSFVRINGNAYIWDYGGARTGTGTEDTSHGHLDLSLVIAAKQFGLGGITNTDMNYLAATMQKVLNGAAGPSDVSLAVDGTGTPANNYDRMSVGYDWIDLADYDSSLLDKTTAVYNKFLADPGSAREFLGWAEILRKKSCVSL